MVRFSNLKYLKILLRYTKRAINPANVQLPWQVTWFFTLIISALFDKVNSSGRWKLLWQTEHDGRNRSYFGKTNMPCFFIAYSCCLHVFSVLTEKRRKGKPSTAPFSSHKNTCVTRCIVQRNVHVITFIWYVKPIFLSSWSNWKINRIRRFLIMLYPGLICPTVPVPSAKM